MKEEFQCRKKCNRIFENKRSRSKHEHWYDKNFRKSMTGENNPSWKGNETKYCSIHIKLRKDNSSPENCTKCGKKAKLELANIREDRKYTRNIEDYKYLCCSCHRKFDGIFIAKGEKHYLSKLTEEQVREIRELYKTKKYYQHELGKKFGVSQNAIKQIVNFKTWKHVV